MFKTESLNLAAALMAHDFAHVGSEPHGGGRTSIVFSIDIPPERAAEAQAIIRTINSQAPGVLGDLVLYEKHRNALRDVLKTMNGGPQDARRKRT